MKILHIIPSMEIGGAQRLLSDLLPLQKQFNSVRLLVFNSIDSAFQNNIKESGIEIINLNSANFYNPFLAWKLIPYLKKCDVTHVHLFPTLYWAAIAAFFCKKVRLVYTEHSTHNKRRDKSYFRPIERLMYGGYAKLISISLQTQNNLKNWLKITSDDNRFEVIENGVNLVAFSLQNIGETNKKQIIMVSRFAAMKDQETVIRAMQYVNNEAELILVGDGSNREYCEEVVGELQLMNRVRFLGTRSDIPQLVFQAYIGVQSSIWEGFGLTAVELMAAHKPVIASNVEGLRQVVEGAGYLFEVGDYKGLACQINELLNDHSLYSEMAEKCYARAQQYDINKMVERYQNVYNELLK